MMTEDWKDKRVLIIGAARQGLALARYLAQKGARVTLNDKRSEAEMQTTLDAMKSYRFRWALGNHDPQLARDADMVCLSGGVSTDLPLVIEARRRGVTLSNDSQIFMTAVKSPVTAITGSAGKTTTTTLVGRMAEAATKPPQRIWVGGNIGLPLIERVDDIHIEDRVILELSSFQLELMHLSPHIAAVLNITPNHLDRHGTLEAYTAAKERILSHQNKDDIAILNRNDPGSWGLKNQVKGQLFTFGLEQPEEGLEGSFCANDMLYLKTGKDIIPLMPVQLSNCAAITICKMYWQPAP